jgi:hypothetical protein
MSRRHSIEDLVSQVEAVEESKDKLDRNRTGD